MYIQYRRDRRSGDRSGSAGFKPPMVPANASLSLTWQLPHTMATQSSVTVTVRRANGTLWQAVLAEQSDQNITLSTLDLQPTTMYSVTVRAGNGRQSVSSMPLRFFTGVPGGFGVDWRPIWIEPCTSRPRNASSRNASFAWFRATLELPAGEEVESALAYASAEGPLHTKPDGCCAEDELGSKILASL